MSLNHSRQYRALAGPPQLLKPWGRNLTPTKDCNPSPTPKNPEQLSSLGIMHQLMHSQENVTDDLTCPIIAMFSFKLISHLHC